MSTYWIELVQSMIYSRITSQFDTSLKNEYSMTSDNFSTTDSANKKAVFPFVFIQTIDISEIGETTEGKEIKGGLFGIQVDVYDNESQNRVRKIRGEVTRIMKSMGFRVELQPITTTDVHRGVARFTKRVADMDVL